MLDLNQVRADFAAHLAANASTRHSLDAALMHVVERSYQRGLEDGADEAFARRLRAYRNEEEGRA